MSLDQYWFISFNRHYCRWITKTNTSARCRWFSRAVSSCVSSRSCQCGYSKQTFRGLHIYQDLQPNCTRSEHRNSGVRDRRKDCIFLQSRFPGMSSVNQGPAAPAAALHWLLGVVEAEPEYHEEAVPGADAAVPVRTAAMETYLAQHWRWGLPLSWLWLTSLSFISWWQNRIIRSFLPSPTGKFGVGVKVYFAFLRYLVYVNLLSCLLTGGLIQAPGIIFDGDNRLHYSGSRFASSPTTNTPLFMYMLQYNHTPLSPILPVYFRDIYFILLSFSASSCWKYFNWCTWHMSTTAGPFEEFKPGTFD